MKMKFLIIFQIVQVLADECRFTFKKVAKAQNKLFKKIDNKVCDEKLSSEG